MPEPSTDIPPSSRESDVHVRRRVGLGHLGIRERTGERHRVSDTKTRGEIAPSRLVRSRPDHQVVQPRDVLARLVQPTPVASCPLCGTRRATVSMSGRPTNPSRRHSAPESFDGQQVDCDEQMLHGGGGLMGCMV